MKIELEFKDEQEIDELYYQIVYRRQNLDLERDKHIKMIKLLTGNESNKYAQSELRTHICNKEFLDKQITIIQSVLEQLEPYATLRYII